MENNLTPEQSLALIDNMINKAKNKLADDGFLLIFWGWLVAASALIHFVCIKLQIEWGQYVWVTFMPLGGVFSAVYGIRQSKKVKVKTYVDAYLSALWIAFGIALFLTIIFIGLHGVKSTYFFLMLLYGIATFVSGGILDFKPLKIGSLFSFACAVVSVFCNETDLLLVIAVAIISSYVIPGHLLRLKFKSENV
ncbi:MAG: hypothetical protein J0L69_03985 [Bacteroidetes bacterium]|nr:hypothetical protein [Bacteroidota bacterium]